MTTIGTSLSTDLSALVSRATGREVLVGLLDLARPIARGQSPTEAITQLTDALSADPKVALAIRTAALEVMGQTRWVHALAESGIVSDKGFFSALKSSLSGVLAPLPHPEGDARTLIRELFGSRKDWRWMAYVDPASWDALAHLLVTVEDGEGEPHPDVAAAIVGLSQRAGALGIDEDINARLHEVEDYGSPFLELTHQARVFLLDDPKDREASFEALSGTIESCRALISKLRKNKRIYGTSVRLTAQTRRLLQQLLRLEILVRLVHLESREGFEHSLVCVFTEMVEAERTAYSVRRIVHEHVDALAFQITEQTARKGAKYITDSVEGYWAFLKAAMAGGAIVAVFAIVKILLSKLPVSLAVQALLYSANYALCFVLIYLTGSILATKQPAVTASAIARKMDAANSEAQIVEGVADMVVLVWRSQFISFVGNLICAFPVAVLITWGLSQAGLVIADSAKAAKILKEIHPFASGALFYAAVAGVFLFLAGVISGWIDNRVIHVSLTERLRHTSWLGVLGKGRDKLAETISNNLGMLMGNIILGGFLGTAGTIGFILGLPFDIRHIAFSSAHFGVATFSAPELMTWQAILFGMIGVTGIGFINFLVSFGLTLLTTLESRQTSFGRWRHLFGILGRRLLNRPMEWLMPQRDPVEETP